MQNCTAVRVEMTGAAAMSTDGEVANALVCKTSIRGFNSLSVLQTLVTELPPHALLRGVALLLDWPERAGVCEAVCAVGGEGMLRSVGRAAVLALCCSSAMAAAQAGRVYSDADYAQAERFMDYNVAGLVYHTVDAADVAGGWALLVSRRGAGWRDVYAGRSGEADEGAGVRPGQGCGGAEWVGAGARRRDGCGVTGGGRASAD